MSDDYDEANLGDPPKVWTRVQKGKAHVAEWLREVQKETHALIKLQNDVLRTWNEDREAESKVIHLVKMYGEALFEDPTPNDSAIAAELKEEYGETAFKELTQGYNAFRAVLIEMYGKGQFDDLTRRYTIMRSTR